MSNLRLIKVLNLFQVRIFRHRTSSRNSVKIIIILDSVEIPKFESLILDLVKLICDGIDSE